MFSGEVLCEFKPEVPTRDRLALLEDLKLTRIGEIPGLDSYQLRYDVSESTLQGIVERLGRDPRVAHAAPHSELKWTTVREYYPAEAEPIPARDKFWHLNKMEAYAAFALMRQLPRTPQTVFFIESGLWKSPTGGTHPDHGTRVDLNRSAAWRPQGWVYPPTLAQLASWSQDADKGFHGTKVIGAACAEWENGGAAGIDPTIRISVLRGDGFGTFLASALDTAASWTGPGFRIIDVTLNDPSPKSNGTYKTAISNAIAKRALVVISAGNDANDVAGVGIASMHAEFFGKPERDALIVVGGTQPTKISGPEADLPETIWRDGSGGSNYEAKSGPQSLIDLAAPAGDVWISGVNGGGQYASGNSFAAPQVSATAALVLSIRPDWPASEVKKCLVSTTDPFPAGPQLSPPYRLWSPHAIGAGRLNVWQALLFALNTKERDAGSNKRYVGVRITADRDDLELWVQSRSEDGSLLLQSLGKPILNRADSTKATRVTGTSVAPASWPVAVILRPRGSTEKVYEMPLPAEDRVERVDRLHPRYVVTVRAFSRGEVRLERSPQSTAPNLARFIVTNYGNAPIDPELLDPKTRNPKDESVRPWMKLANGDSFALKATVTNAAPGTTATILNGNMTPFPQQDDDKNPYVTVPFAGQTATFHVRVNFPAGVPPAADVFVEATSLNNQIVHAAVMWKLKPTVFEGEEAPGMLNGPLNWAKFGAWRFRNSHATPLRFWLNAKVDVPGWYSNGALVDVPPGGETVATVGFAPPSGTTFPVGKRVNCDVVSVDDLRNPTGFSHRFEGVIGEPPSVHVTSSGLWVAEFVQMVEGAPFVFAEFPIQIVNRSPYPVALWRRYHEVTGAVPTTHPEWVQVLPDSGEQPISIIKIRANETLNARIRFHYDLKLAWPPTTNPRVMNHAVTLYLLDPNLLALAPIPPNPPADFSGYRAQSFAVTIKLRLG